MSVFADPVLPFSVFPVVPDCAGVTSELSVTEVEAGVVLDGDSEAVTAGFAMTEETDWDELSRVELSVLGPLP